MKELNTLAPSDYISAETAEFLEAYSIPSGVIDVEGQWLFKNLALKRHLAPLDKKCFFALLYERKQEDAVKKRITQNKRVQLIEAMLVSPIADMIAYSARVQFANSNRPVYLIELHLRTQRLHAFSSLNHLHQVKNKHEKKTLTTNLQLKHAVSESLIDPLTKIANRRALDEQMLAVWEQAFHSRTPFSFLMLDLDFFKKLNDIYGHSQGDQALVQVAETLAKNVNRKGDIVARFGGEEFSVLLPNTYINDAKHVANKLLVAVRQLNIPNSGSDTEQFLTISAGGYTVKPSQPEADLSSVIRFADLALYRAKAKGKNCAVHHGFTRN